MTFGIASVDFFEVTDGLMPGDEVVDFRHAGLPAARAREAGMSTDNHDGAKALTGANGCEP